MPQKKNGGSNKCSSRYTPLTQLELSVGKLSTDCITLILPSADGAVHPSDALHDLRNGQTSSTA